MIQEAFDFSEKYHTPVFFRPTTRVDHGYESIEVKEPEDYYKTEIEGFVKDASKWVIFPRLSVKNHALIEERNLNLRDTFSNYKRNFIDIANNYSGRKAIATQGINYSYTKDAFGDTLNTKILRVATPFPFPENLALEFLQDVDEVLCVEELDPVIERALLEIVGRHNLKVTIKGKLTGDVKASGENTIESVRDDLSKFLDMDLSGDKLSDLPAPPELPVRPPVLCAGCPHRASFYAIKQAIKKKKTIYCGDIGCYTLGNAKPLDMTDTCLCMGAGINIAQGVTRIEPDTKAFAFVGDSTFFASGITGVINAFYNQADMTLVVLDNSTTAMTGHQPHPGTGKTLMGDVVDAVSIEKVLRAIGLKTVETLNPLNLKASVEAVKRIANEPGVKCIIFKSPCIVKYKPTSGKAHVDPNKCISCGKCIKELGCPAIILKDNKAFIDESLCTGCTLCQQVCPVNAISGGGGNE